MTDIRERLVEVIRDAHDGDPQAIAPDVIAAAILAEFPVLQPPARPQTCPACGTVSGALGYNKICINPWHAAVPENTLRLALTRISYAP